MKNILLPTDFSENSWNAIKYCLHFFYNEPCNFYVLHVNRLSNLTVNDSGYIPSQEEIEGIYIKPAKKQLRQLLKRISEEFQDNDKHRFFTLTEYNLFVESVRKNVSDKKIDLIIMGTKGASGLKKHIVGSNTGDVITKVQTNVLVIPEDATFKPIEEVAFPSDFLPYYSVYTLQPILDILKTHEAALRLIYIDKKRNSLNQEQKENKELIESFFEDVSTSFHYLTNKNVEAAIQCFVESRDIDMISMVAKNLNYFQQILFHSRVEKISYHIEIPFLVLHE